MLIDLCCKCQRWLYLRSDCIHCHMSQLTKTWKNTPEYKKYMKKQAERRKTIRRRSTPLLRARDNIRKRLKKLLKGKTSSFERNPLPYTTETLKKSLESHFKEPMNWNNYGTLWHIDHRRPLASFDLTDPIERKQANSLSNLQPLLAQENMRKGAKYEFI